MFENVYIGSIAKIEEFKAQNMLKELYKYFKENPDKRPSDQRCRVQAEGIDRVVCDYIAGMTDRYAIFVFTELFVPKSWQIR